MSVYGAKRIPKLFGSCNRLLIPAGGMYAGRRAKSTIRRYVLNAYLLPSYSIQIVATVTEEKERTQRPGGGLGGDWRVVVLNDSHNTFDHVANAIASFIPGVNFEKGYEIANKIHSSGQAIVWSGHKEAAEHYWEQLNSAGLTMAPLERS